MLLDCICINLSIITHLHTVGFFFQILNTLTSYFNTSDFSYGYFFIMFN